MTDKKPLPPLTNEEIVAIYTRALLKRISEQAARTLREQQRKRK